MISEEVIGRKRDEEGPWGSVFFHDWQIITSKSFSGPLAAFLRWRPVWLPDLGLGTRTFRYTERGRLQRTRTTAFTPTGRCTETLAERWSLCSNRIA